MRTVLLAILLSVSHLAMAENAPTIYDSGVNWDDVAARKKMLEMSTIPAWNGKILAEVNDIYNHPRQHKIPANTDKQKYNTLFLDVYWGPITNPFVKYARPAKVFVYFDEFNKTTSYMAPVVKNESDGNFYVFNGTKRPLLLEEWINEIKVKQAQQTTVKFNICNGYATRIDEPCVGKEYEYEAAYALSNTPNYAMRFNAANKSESAYRDPYEDWQKHSAITQKLIGTAFEPASIEGSSVSWDNVKKRHKLLNTTASWQGYKNINKNLEKLRDIRYFNDKQKGGFLRRISWLYPDDGCWTRASAVINHFFGAVENSINEFTRPSKIFAFGNLCANTPNHKRGKVTWWYHTAPLIQDSVTNQVYVLDPSIDPQKPMKVENWMKAIAANTGACKDSIKPKVDKFNVCTGFGTTPYDVCAGKNGENFTKEAEQALWQGEFHVLERQRQEQLGRDADKVLGDEAPWM